MILLQQIYPPWLHAVQLILTESGGKTELGAATATRTVQEKHCGMSVLVSSAVFNGLWTNSEEIRREIEHL